LPRGCAVGLVVAPALSADERARRTAVDAHGHMHVADSKNDGVWMLEFRQIICAIEKKKDRPGPVPFLRLGAASSV